MGRPKHLINGKTATSVTTLFGDLDANWKEFWFRKHGFEECDRIRDESASFGKKVHALVEKHLRGEPYELIPNDRVSTCAGLIIEWCKQAQVKPVTLLGGKPAMEFEVVSKELLLVGHPDLICTFGDSPVKWIADWKTAKKMSLGYTLQVAAYALCWFEMTGEKINDAAIIRVEKDPAAEVQFEALEIHNIFEVYVPLVKAAKAVHDFFNKRGAWAKTKKEAI